MTKINLSQSLKKVDSEWDKMRKLEIYAISKLPNNGKSKVINLRAESKSNYMFIKYMYSI